jgi:hypothetical protein
MCCFLSTKGEESFCVYKKWQSRFVWCANTSSTANSNLFRCKEVLVLLDPQEGGASYTTGAGMPIFAAINDEKHFRGDSAKVTGDCQRIPGPFTDAELEVSLPRMGFHDADKALKRAKVVGSLPFR